MNSRSETRVDRTMKLLRLFSTLMLLAAAAPGLSGQGVIVDEGSFAVTIGGVLAGTEDFVIRRPGVGREDAVFANGSIELELPDGLLSMSALLHAAPPDGIAVRYQLSASGLHETEVQVARSGRRYLSTIRSAEGAEDREFQAHVDTRVLEGLVAHHYYFLRDLRPERSVHTLEPRSRTQGVITAGPPDQEVIRLGPNEIQARRVQFTTEAGDVRTIWYDRQGRVLRVSIASLNYLAERTDLVG